MEEHAIIQKTLKWLENLSKGNLSHQLEELTLEGLQIIDAHKGSIRCSFVIPSHASVNTNLNLLSLLYDRDGNWHVGAMATLIDDVAAAAIYSIVDHVKVSLDFSISFHSTARIQEEVEIEARVVAEKGKLAQRWWRLEERKR
ncbi:putative pentatricopeptide repeat-containing protein [Hibiscus syriacus]|uniref:Pentatricopeptide repeat-containing protein n=1 Tax=Hibiscus syriacus TaxID=106335 RepID=A0A6A2YN78_HIBSY|nr:putative pentatricopeptide repeat-containing protein [Hibiscus syriacus]